MPLAQYVEENVIDPLTDNRHRLLREVSKYLHSSSAPIDPTLSAQLENSLHTLPESARSLVELRKIYTHSLDMAALIRNADELFEADKEWAGRAYIDELKKQQEEEQKRVEAEHERALAESSNANAMQYLAFAIKSHEQAQAVGAFSQAETADVLQHALEYSGELVVKLANRGKQDGDVKMEGSADEDAEDPLVRKLRLNLLSLAKRAPLDKLSRLPSNLVPEAIRHIVPTIDSTA